MVAGLQTHVAYRCPECGTVIYGFVGKFALSANLVRVKCSCGHSAIDINITNDNKVRLSVPCVFCKQNHNFVVSQNIFFGRDIFLLNCPYANMDICFIGAKDKVDTEVAEASEKLRKLLSNLEVEQIKDIQPMDMDDDEVLPDPSTYDTIRFLVKELEAEKKIDCPCHSGIYDLRFCDDGIQVYCPECEATHTFNTAAVSASEDYLNLDFLNLT